MHKLGLEAEVEYERLFRDVTHYSTSDYLKAAKVMDPSEDVVMSPLEAGALSDGTKGLPETVYVHHKILPLKHADGEPLTREDIQHDLLYHIFQDPNACFTDQTPDAKQPGPYPKVTFCELYVNSILNSPKCTKVARDKMIETPSYAVEFAKMCLLVNVGRINTTLACML